MHTAIIVAGGSGTRMGDLGTIKQFADVCGKPLIIHTLKNFEYHKEIDKIIIGCREDYAGYLHDITVKEGFCKIQAIVPGGLSRQETVFNCLKRMNCEKKENSSMGDDIVLIHDAVRPLVTKDIISGNIKAAKEHGAVNTVIPTADTLAISYEGITIDEIPPRSAFYQVQTPQSFIYGIILNAHINAEKKGVTDSTDDCRLVMETGKKIFLTKGDRLNFKITTNEDLILLRAVIGAGFGGDM